MAKCIVIMNAKWPEDAEILTDEFGQNKVFKDKDTADHWIERNARIGWSTLIVELD